MRDDYEENSNRDANSYTQAHPPHGFDDIDPELEGMEGEEQTVLQADESKIPAMKARAYSGRKEVKRSVEKPKMPVFRTTGGNSFVTSEQVFEDNSKVFEFLNQTQARRDEIRRLLKSGLLVFDPNADYAGY